MNRFKLIVALLLLANASFSVAVQLGRKGVGEVLIYPYYTVNNSLNSLYSVVNTTDQPKAFSVRFLEGEKGLEVLLFNVYIDAYDVWTGALVPVPSTIPNHEGEPSVMHVTGDHTCAPFLNKGGQEFLPYVIDSESAPEDRNMQRATAGHIEILELGVVTGAAAAAIDHGSIGIPANCASIQNDWSDNGQWDAELLDDPSGGLLGTGTIVNVAEGLAFTYEAVALQNFWQGPGVHADPGSLEPDLNAAFPETKILLDSGELITSTWDHGYQAISALLTQAQVVNEYALDAFIVGRTEWVMTFPTKGFHVEGSDTELAPFSADFDGEICDRFRLEQWDREAQYSYGGRYLKSPRPPGGYLPRMCDNSNVLELVLPGGSILDNSRVLGAYSRIALTMPAVAVTENGWARANFERAEPTVPLTGTAIKGLPVIGFAVTQFTNGGAAQGLLAQYGSLSKHKYTYQVVPEIEVK